MTKSRPCGCRARGKLGVGGLRLRSDAVGWAGCQRKALRLLTAVEADAERGAPADEMSQCESRAVWKRVVRCQSAVDARVAALSRPQRRRRHSTSTDADSDADDDAHPTATRHTRLHLLQ